MLTILSIIVPIYAILGILIYKGLEKYFCFPKERLSEYDRICNDLENYVKEQDLAPKQVIMLTDFALGMILFKEPKVSYFVGVFKPLTLKLLNIVKLRDEYCTFEAIQQDIEGFRKDLKSRIQVLPVELHEVIAYKGLDNTFLTSDEKLEKLLKLYTNERKAILHDVYSCSELLSILRKLYLAEQGELEVIK